MKNILSTAFIFHLFFLQSGQIYSQNLYGVFSGGKVAIKGESTFAGHTNEIDIISYQLELQKNARGVENKIFMILKSTDAASTALYQTMYSNEVKTFTIENFQSAKSGIQTLKTTLEFEKAQIVSIRQWYDEGKQKTLEEVKFNYNKLKMSYNPKNQEVEISLGDSK